MKIVKKYRMKIVKMKLKQ